MKNNINIGDGNGSKFIAIKDLISQQNFIKIKLMYNVVSLSVTCIC